VTVPFQFMTYGVAATQKILISGLQGRDANAFGGMAALTGFAYIGNYLRAKTSEDSERAWNRQSSLERWTAAVDQSGLLGHFSDLNKLIETGTRGEYGLRPMLGVPTRASGYDQAARIGGPFGSKVMDAYRVFTDETLDDHQTAGIIRRAVPLNGLFYVDALGREAQEVLGY